MEIALRRLILIVCLAAFGNVVSAAEFHGWEALRVVAVEGQPERFFAADLNGDGRQELVLINTRQSRLDLYRWLPPAERKPIQPSDPNSPNELPLAPDWGHAELALDDLPADAVAADLDGDKRPELLVVTGPTLKLSAYRQEADKRWQRFKQWDLLTGQLAGRGRIVLLRTGANNKRELLISCEQGIQVVPIDEPGRAQWYHPRETAGRVDWRLVDLDGDGDEDLLEWTTKANQSVRWYECAEGALRPPQALHDQSVTQVGALNGGNTPADILCLGGAQTGLLRRYQLARGEESPYGRRATLPIAGTTWCGVKLDGAAALAALDPTEPKIRVYRLVDDQWASEESYPTLGGIRELAAPAARPGTLLLWTKEAADLYETRWEHGRLTFPKPLVKSPETADRRIVALETVDDTLWWAQRVGDNLDLYVWPADAKEPKVTRFEKAGAKIERVLWLGGERILVQQAYSSAAKLLTLEKGKVVTADLPHLAKVNLAEYRLYRDGKRLRPGRLADGVLQWLDDSLLPQDQVMLPDGQKLAGYVPLADGEALALEQGGQFLHRLKTDASGIARTTLSVKLSGGVALRQDPVLGLFVVDGDRIARLSAGRPWELKLRDTIDGRRGRPSGVKEATIHRFFTTDIDGDGRDDLVLCDDRKHNMSVMERQGDELRDVVSWQVLEDQAYPYGEERSSVPVAEPRSIVSFDADGDGNRDLGLLSQDRLLLYVGREEKK
ncbi:MAG: hypothetical protein C0483_20365 [Pirellula sp.]|nr:hypothetical protein [Pirellula sp.]